jgi:circadian clock protein KaiB
MKYEFILFIAAKKSKKSVDISNCVRKLLVQKLKDNFKLSLVDVIDNPELALNEEIFVTPSWVRVVPGPRVKIVGNFCEEKNASKGFELFMEVNYAVK